MGLLDILQQYADPARAPDDRVHAHFDEVAQQSSPQALGNGVAAAFRSDATPPFGQMIGSLFGQSNPQQRAGILDQLVQVLGSGALSSIAGGALGRVLGGAGNATPTITPSRRSRTRPRGCRGDRRARGAQGPVDPRPRGRVLRRASAAREGARRRGARDRARTNARRQR